MRKLNQALLVAVWAALLASSVLAATHCEIQSVDANGNGNHPDLLTTNKVTVTGIILNRPQCMVDSTPNYSEIPYHMGAEWQMFIQGQSDDPAGTALYMAQCYGNLPWGAGRYTNVQWQDQLYRLNHDPNTGYAFRPGDLVEVTGLLKFYNGKTNINERHSTAQANQFTIKLVTPAFGLPAPELVTLGQLKNSDGTFIFDANRNAGGELYQGRLVRINNVSFVGTPAFTPDTTATITDGTYEFPVKLGLGVGFNLYGNNLPATFDVIGIFDQEGSATGDYRLWVTDYDGNGLVLKAAPDGGTTLPADADRDNHVTLTDLALLAQDWLTAVTGY